MPARNTRLVEATAITARRTQEGFELACAFSYTGKAPGPAERKRAALALLREIHGAAERGAVDTGFHVNSQQRTGRSSMSLG